MDGASSRDAHDDVARTRASGELGYRGFSMRVAASAHAGRILVVMTLTGGPEHIVRKFGRISAEADPVRACGTALIELRRMVDEMLARAPNAAPPRCSGRHPLEARS